MTKKVILPRDVAEAIESLRRLGHDNRRIIGIASDGMHGEKSDVIKGYLRADDGNFTRLMSALVNGYEIEQSPEETLRQYYGDAKSNSRWAIDGSGNQIRYKERVEAVETTLRILGIQIEGINAASNAQKPPKYTF